MEAGDRVECGYVGQVKIKYSVWTDSVDPDV